MHNDKPAGYEKPTVADYGEITELTAQQTNGSHLDHTYTGGTPSTQLTFS